MSERSHLRVVSTDDTSHQLPEALATAISWGHLADVLQFAAAMGSDEQATVAEALLASRSTGWAWFDDALRADHHRHRQAWRVGLAALFATADYDALIAATELEHAYGESCSDEVMAALEQRRPEWTETWVEHVRSTAPPETDLDAVAARLSAAGLIPAATRTVAEVQVRIAQAVADGDLVLAELLRRRVTDPVGTGQVDSGDGEPPAGVLAFGRPPVAAPVQLSPAALQIERDLLAQRLDTWMWHLSDALFLHLYRHDAVSARTAFEQALALNDDQHPEPHAEFAFFADHQLHDQTLAARHYTLAEERAPNATRDQYPAILAELAGRPGYRHAATIARHVAFRARRGDDVDPDAELSRALFAQRRASDAPGTETSYLRFLRRLVAVAEGAADLASLDDFAEWAGPSVIEPDPI